MRIETLLILFMATSYQADAAGEAVILQLVERAMVLVEAIYRLPSRYCATPSLSR
jgi:hypothetical protein